MTYCVAIKLNAGLVCLADTRTNAGIDNISKFKKLFTWKNPGERAITMMTSGNLAITQAVMSLLQENVDNPKGNADTLLSAASMFRVAEIVGEAMRTIQTRYGPGLSARGENSTSSILVSGQRKGGKPRLFMIYSAGNFIEATSDTPFLQIGEHKYGKPILDRVIQSDTPLDDALTASLLSMESTLNSNLSVGMPLDLTVQKEGAFDFDQERRIEPDDPAFEALSNAWSNDLKQAFKAMRRSMTSLNGSPG